MAAGPYVFSRRPRAGRASEHNHRNGRGVIETQDPETPSQPSRTPPAGPSAPATVGRTRRSRRLAGYLTPRALPFGVRKLDPGHNRPQFFTYIYSRPAIERALAREGLQWVWHGGLGVSRAGWFAHEVNTALVVSRKR